MTSLYTSMPSSTSHPSPLTLRRCTTINRPNIQQGLVIEYSLINPPGTSQQTERALDSCESHSKILPPLREMDASIAYNARRQSRPWLGLSNIPHTATADKKKRLERMNLRGDSRNISRASNSQRTNSSCKRSDSATNDSQKSAQTTNSVEDRLSEDRIRQVVQFEQQKSVTEEPTEEKLEQRRNFEKCMNWIEALPSKFSGMHIAQERAPVMKD